MNMFQKAEQLTKYAFQYKDEYGKVSNGVTFDEDGCVLTLGIEKGYRLFPEDSCTALAVYYLTVRENSFDLELTICCIRKGPLCSDAKSEEKIFKDKPYESVEELFYVIDRIRSVAPVIDRHLKRIRRDSDTEEMFTGKMEKSIKAGIFNFDKLLREPKMPVYDLPVLQIATEVNDYVINRYPEAYYSLKTKTTPKGDNLELSLRNTASEFFTNSSVTIDVSVYYSNGECGVGIAILPDNVVSGNVHYSLKPIITISEIYEQIERVGVILDKAMKKMFRITRSVGTKEDFLNIIKEAVNNNEFSVQKLENEK